MARPLRFLVVEDEVLIAMCLEMELEQAGYVVCRCVESGDDAILAATQYQPDVILMDIRLAGELDGIEAAWHIRELAPIPIVFMTGYSDSEERKRANELHPLGFFVKPIRMQDIQSVIASVSQSS